MKIPPEILFEKQGHLMLRVLLKPQSRRTGILGIQGQSLKVGVNSPPVDGKANDALLSLMAQVLGCSRSSIFLEQGAASRNKLLSLAGLDMARVSGILEKLLADA